MVTLITVSSVFRINTAFSIDSFITFETKHNCAANSAKHLIYNCLKSKKHYLNFFFFLTDAPG